MVKRSKTQSITEYLLFLTMVVLAIFIGTGFLRRGLQSGLNQTEQHLQRSLPQTLNLDSNLQGQIIPFDLPNSQGGE